MQKDIIEKVCTPYESAKKELKARPRTWLITGVAGFIGSNLLETLLLLNQKVVGLDNFATGFQHNLDEVKKSVATEQWRSFNFIEGDICEIETCRNACAGIQHVLHQAALGSVPRSIADPITTNKVNINGFLNMLVAARDAKVSSFTYAASSSTYGDHPGLPKLEDQIGKPLSPYAITKYVNEIYAEIFSRCYGFDAIGLRYFNVFGKRQDPDGDYAAVIPKWMLNLIKNETISINGDGETSRDFCYIENVVQANILAATANSSALNEIYNIAVGEATSLNQLLDQLKKNLGMEGVNTKSQSIYRDFREGDVRHSLADINKAKRLIGYEPNFRTSEGLEIVTKWYVQKHYSRSLD